jgi:hypothetical protein
VTHGATFAQLPRDLSKLICHCCGKTGHIVPVCPDRLIIPPKKWHHPKDPKKVLSQTAVATGADTDTEQEQTELEPEPPSSEEDTRTTRRRSATPAPARKRGSHSQRGGPSRDDDGWATLQYEDPLGPMWTPPSFVVMNEAKAAPSVDSKWSTLFNNTILLDTGSTISGTMMNPDFVTGH